MNTPAPAPSEELNRLLLDCLDWMDDKYRAPPYEPDADDSENLKALVIKLHIAAARTFKLKQLEMNHMSEEWVSSLRSVERMVQRINAIASPYGSRYWDPSFAVTADAIWGLTQLELSRVSRAEGSYEDAIERLAQAAYRYMDASASVWSTGTVHALLGIDLFGTADNVDIHGGNPWTSSLDWDEETINHVELPARRDIEDRFTPLQVSLEEVASLFRLLKQSTPTDANWRRISADCDALAILPDDVFTGTEDWVVNEEGNLTLTWSEFWHGAGAWASAQLSPSEYKKMRQDDEREAAESRLTNYFFDTNWPYLPERARRRLINADLIWNSPQRVSRESILNDLLRATEEMCERFVFQSLMNEESTTSSILCIEAKVAEKHRSLGVREYIEICELPSLPGLLSERGLTDCEISFLTEELPASMRNLAGARNPAEHDTGISVPSVLVDSAYRMFIGIGRAGILPQLAQIGLKLQRRRPRQGR